MKEQDSDVKWFNTVFYPQRKTGRAVRYEDGVLPRLRQEAIILFTPWGPRYSWQERGEVIQPDDAEMKTLRKLAELFNEMVANMPGKQWRWLIMGADLYGTAINSVPERVVSTYFQSLNSWLAELLPTVEFRLWSEFAGQAQDVREQMQRNVHTLVPERVMGRMHKVAGTGSFVGSAEQYVVERLTEAHVIEELYHPIKLPAVGRHKDDFVDGKLPRVYLVPEELHAPWK